MKLQRNFKNLLKRVAASLMMLLMAIFIVLRLVNATNEVIVVSFPPHDQLASNFDQQPIYAQLSADQEFGRIIQSASDKWFKQFQTEKRMTNLGLLQQVSPMERLHCSIVFPQHKVPIRTLHCCYRI